MPDKKPLIEPGQVTAIPESNYDVNKDLGRAIDRTRIVDSPSSPNLLFNDGVPYTFDGQSKVNPAYASYISILKNSPSNPLTKPYYTNLDKTERYSTNAWGGFHPFDINQENWYGENQSWFDQWGNRIAKFGIKAIGSFANSLMDIPNMVNAISEGNIDKMWDNPTNTWASDMMDWSEKALPNYETTWERQHPFLNLVPFYGNSGNSWGKVLENVGFTVGAIGGAITEDLIVGALTGGVGEVPLAAHQINKAVYRLGKLMNAGEDAQSALRTTIKSADDLISGLRGVDRFNYAVRQGLWGANMITSGFSEASFEGIESHKTLTKDLRQEFFEANGRNPNYEEAQEIENTGRRAANSRFLLNAGLLSLTNTIQWGSLLRPFNVTKELLEAEAKSGIRVGLAEGSKDLFTAIEPTSRLAKLKRLALNNKVANLLSQSSSEGFEEGAQFLIQTGVDDYYKRQYNDPSVADTNNFLKSFSLGLSKTLGTTEGWENIVLGLLGGAMYKGGEHLYYNGKGMDKPNYKKEIENLLKGLNSQSLTGIFENKYGEAVAANAIEGDMQRAVKTGNVFAYQNYKHEHFTNFVLSGIKQNKFDVRIEQLNELKKLNEQEFSKTFGIPSTTENQRTVGQYVDRLVENANYIKEVSDRVNRTFINPFSYRGTGNYKNTEEAAKQNAENERYIAYQGVKDQLIYGMSVMKDSRDRVTALRNSIANLSTVIPVDTAVQLSSDEGLTDLKTDYKSKIKDLEKSLELDKSARTKKELAWYRARVEEIDDTLSEENTEKQNLVYNNLLNNVFDKLQEEADTLANNGKKPRKKSVFQRPLIKDILDVAKDISYLRKRDEAAVANYAALTTKGGFEKLFNDILKIRKETAEKQVELKPEVTQPTNPQQQTVFNEAQANEGQPTTKSPNDNPQQGFEEVTQIPVSDEDQRTFANFTKQIIEGKYKPSDDELEFLGFKTIDDLKFDNPSLDITQFVKVKGQNGKNWYLPKSVVDERTALLGEAGIKPPTPPAEVPPQVKGREPLRVDDFLDKAFVPNDLRVIFQDSIWSEPKEQFIKDMTVTVRPLTPEFQKEFDDQKVNKTYTVVPDFPGVFVAKSPIDISMSYKGQEIGKLPFPERLLFNVNGQYLTIDKLTPEQYNQFTGKHASQHNQDIIRYKSYVMFKNLLALKFKNSETGSATLSPEELQKLIDVTITYGEDQRVTKEQDRPTYNTLKHNTISLKTSDGNQVDTMAILSVPKRYQADSAVRTRTEYVNIIFNRSFYDIPNVDDRAVRSWINVSLNDIHNVGSRYIGLVQQPNGIYRMVALRPASMSTEERNEVFDSLKDRAILSSNTNFIETTAENAEGKILFGDEEIYYKLPNDEAKKFNDEFNTNINNTMFITDEQGKSFFNLSVSPIGALRLEVFEPVSNYSNTFYIAPHKVEGIKSFEAMLDMFNKQIQKVAKDDPKTLKLKLNVQASNFKKSLADDASVTAEDIAPNLTSAVTVEGYTNGTLRFQPKAKEIGDAYKEAGGKLKLDQPAATQKEKVVKDIVNPTPEIPTGIFGGLKQLNADETGNLVPFDIDDVSSPVKNTVTNQEDMSNIEFPTVKDALESMGIGYSPTGPNDTIIYFDIVTMQPLDFPSSVSPADLVKELKLNVKAPKPDQDETFDFRRSDTGENTIDRLIDIEKARSYITSVLPSFISVEDINVVLENLQDQGVENPSETVWGGFQDGVIYLNDKASDIGVEYHEAFHAVFGMILPKDQQQRLIQQSLDEMYKELNKKGTSIRNYIAEQRAAGVWKDLSTSEAYEKAAEEYMAEKFREWKNKKESSSPFAKLFDLIRRFFKWLLRDKNELEAIFRNIDTGVYRYSNPVGSSFTTDSNDEFQEPEFRFMLVPARPGKMKVGKGEITLKRNLDTKTSKQVVQNVASYFTIYRKLDNFTGMSDDKLLDNILDDLNRLYSVDNPLYATMSQEDINELNNSDESYIYSNPDSRETIKEAAKKYINSINYVEQFNESVEEEEEDDRGTPSTGYDNRAENVGGFSSLPGLLRQYIGFTTFNKIDEFGNKEVISGVPVIGTVDAVHVYYGLMRSLANTTDPVRFFQKMILFADDNEQSRFFVEKFIADTGLNVEALMQEGKIEATKNKALLELVKKGFNKFRIDYIFTEHDIKKGLVKSYYANRKNVENIQFDKWSNNFLNSYTDYSEDYRKNVRDSLTSTINKYFDERRIVKYDTDKLNTAIRETQQSLRGVGIYLSKAYLKYSLLAKNAKKFDELDQTYQKEGLTLNFDDPQNKFITKQDYDFVRIMKISDETTLSRDFLDELLKTLAAGNNPFFKDVSTSEYFDEDLKQVIKEEVEIDTAMIGRILNLGKGNALFDESVGESSYTNAENKVVYAHQDGTYNVKYSYQLRNPEYRKQLREKGYRDEISSDIDVYDSEWLTKNALLNSDSFEAIADNLLFQRIDGMRAVETNKLGKVITKEFRDQKEGVTYGHYSPREMIVNLLNNYISYAKEQRTGKKSIMTAPHLVRVLEASKTADTVNLPINVDMYKSGTVTDKAVNQLINELEKEFNRINRVQGEIGKLIDNIVENYHTGAFADDGYTVTKGYRGLKFTDNVTATISKQTADLLEQKARTNQPLTEQDKTNIAGEITSNVNKLVDDTIVVLEKEGIVRRDDKGNFVNVLLHNDFFKGNASLNLSNKFKENIGQVIVNDYLNTLSFNQILHGDSALSLKNDGGIDAVKRAKGDNAAIVSMRTDVTDERLGITDAFTHSKVAIFKEPVSVNGTKIADAQMFTTVRGLRYTLWGLGRLTPRLASVLDALENGEDIHNLKDENGYVYDAVFDKDNGILKWDEMTNSLKLVYKDGKTYFKMSVVVLQPTLTSYKDKQGNWKPRPGWETLHNLRLKMEKDSIDFSAPESASKMMSLDVGKDIKSFTDLKGHLFDNNYFGLQTVNPSNKLEITTPTQLLQLIDSEQDDNVNVFFNGVDHKVKDVKDAYQSYVTQKVNNAYDIAKKEIYSIEDFNADIDESIAKGEVTPRLAKFQKRALETLEASGSDAQLLDFFALDENGVPKFNLNLNATKTKFGQLYLAYFSKGILSQKSPGYSVALMSGMDTRTLRKATKVENGEVVAWEHVRRDQWDTNFQNVQNEKIFQNRSDVTEVGEYFLDELQYNVPEFDNEGNIIGYYSEMMLPAHYQEMLSIPRDKQLPDAITKGFAVRIPSQDKHSFMSLKLIDFLPANLGSTGMFPKELVELSGADFDIDKAYISRYDFYAIKDKRGNNLFKKYGDATSIGEKWEEYKIWMSKNNKVIKGIIKDLGANDPDYQRLVLENKIHENADLIEEIDNANLRRAFKEEYKDLFITQALKQVGLPSTIKEFEEASSKRELNNGVLNNNIIDSYVALLTNKGMQEIAKTPASLTALINIQKEGDIQLRDKNGNSLASAFSKNTSYPVDSIIGKYFSFRNNTTGKDNIGIDVNANLIYSLLNKAGITIKESEKVQAFEFDGVKFVSFAGNNQYNLNTKRFDGERTNDILSTLISSATDEAKEQLNALYGLGVDALKVVDYLVALKVPLKTAIYLVNQPAISNYLELKGMSNNTLQTSDEEKLFSELFREQAIAKMNKDLKDYEQYSDEELFTLFEKQGLVEVIC